MAADDGGDGNEVQVGEVTVDVLLGGVASSGLVVVFHEPDGAIAGQAMTDSFGTATGTVRSGAMVTIAVDSKNLVTITSVAPGDHLILKTAKPFDNSAYGTVMFTASAEANGKSFYRTEVGSDNYVTTANVTTGADRVFDLKAGNRDAGGRIHVVSTAYNASNQIVAYSSKLDLVPTQNGATNVSLGGWLTDIVNIQVLLSGAPTDASLLTIDSANERSGFQFAPCRFAGTDSAPVSGGGASVTVPYLGSFGDFVQTKANLTFPSAAKTTFTWMRRVPRPAGNYVITASDMPPRLTSVMLDTANPMRPSAHWTSSATKGDAIVARMSWGDNSGGTFYWYAYAPPDAAEVTFPVVPSALAGQSPGQSSTSYGVQVIHHDLEPLAGYDAFRTTLPVDFANPEDMPLGFTTWVRSSN